jgi:hypothetical protein
MVSATTTKTEDRSANIKRELRIIARKHHGLLRPVDVVEYASNPKTALHDCFTWDDTEAAQQYRLWQARQIIRVRVQVIPQHTEPVKVWVSMKDDRYREGGGYRGLVPVMSDQTRKTQLVAEALEDLKVWRRKYDTLKELSTLFEAVDEFIESRNSQVAN